MSRHTAHGVNTTRQGRAERTYHTNWYVSVILTGRKEPYVMQCERVQLRRLVQTLHHALSPSDLMANGSVLLLPRAREHMKLLSGKEYASIITQMLPSRSSNGDAMRMDGWN